MKNKMIVAGSVLMLALMTMTGLPAQARADRLYVGFNVGGVFAPYGDYPRHVRYRPPPPPDYGWYRERPYYPPRGWYRHHPPPVYYESRRPHHRHHHWHHDRW